MNRYRALVVRILVIGCFLMSISSGTVGQSSSDPLTQGFMQPPDTARPMVWWHWMDGNITKEGIKLDLEWMHRVRLRGFQIFDAALATPQVVNHRLAYMTPEWKDAFRYATTLADQMGMEEAIASSPGWSETGGPWVPASQGMKKYVWSETVVEGGKPFSGTLLHPPSVTGPFQNLGMIDLLTTPADAPVPPQFYADVAVIAYRRAPIDVPLASLQPKITASAGSPDLALLNDGDLQKATKLPSPAVGESEFIQYEFPEPQEIRSLTIVTKDVSLDTTVLFRIPNPEKSLVVSDDGQNFRTVTKLPDSGAPQHTISFPPVRAKYFRVLFKKVPPPPLPSWSFGLEPESFGLKTAPPATGYEIAELTLHPGARVNRFEEKAAFTPVPDIYGFATPPVPAKDAVSKADVIDLTSKMHPDGTLDWTPPAGNWVVLRFGYSLLGIMNQPATAEATGLEVDKLNSAYVKNYMNRYLDTFAETVGADFMGKRGIQYMINDSWEDGSQNWTDDMIAQFRKLRGYDPVPWMPVLAGQVVESAEACDRFLWDFRKTISDLIAEEHYGQVKASLRQRGMGQYGESHEYLRAFVGDGMEVKKRVDIPMSAMWAMAPGVDKEQYGNNADDRESASVAHIYGQNLAAAESLTTGSSPWAWSPSTLKPIADQELLNGINRFVIHESAHQPLIDKAPGLTLGPFGQWFNRNETWADKAGAWMDYLARSSYLLQQGRFAADVIYFYGEDSNLTAIFDQKAPDVPAEYGFDYINADGLIHELGVAEGRITTKSGMNYRVLALDPNNKHMSLPVLRALYSLVEQGAIVAGEKPVDTPSLADDAVEFKRLNDELFGDAPGPHSVGKGKVYAGSSVESVLQALNVTPDFDHTKPESDTRILFVHRKLSSSDVYFLDNRSNRDERVDASFRVTGRVPELWYAETGRMEPTSYSVVDGRTRIPLHLEPWGTVFVVFRRPATRTSLVLPRQEEVQLATLDGPWSVSFPPGRGAPPVVKMDELSSWTDSEDKGVKYFSGVGTYTKTIQAAENWFKPNASVWIDLGDVKNLAEVAVNGKSLGVVWHAPYRVDLTGTLKPGANEISIQVINTWVNRFIGDEQPDATEKYAFADVKPYKANSPLLRSGLLGPVWILSLSNRQRP
jgi:hypothetical protein